MANEIEMIPLTDVEKFCVDVFGPFMHKKRCQSLAYGAFGAIHADRLSPTAAGRAMAQKRNKEVKHGIKQVDRMLSNEGIDMKQAFEGWVTWVIGDRNSIFVSMDWTDFADNNQTRIALNLITSHGRATPLIWITVEKSSLKDQRNHYEDEALALLQTIVPEHVEVTILADRGFGDTALYDYISSLGFYYVIRFRGCIKMRLPDGSCGQAQDYLAEDGSPLRFESVELTGLRKKVPAVVTVHAKDMQDPWFLATNRCDSAQDTVSLYGERFTTEETFRDEKDRNFGMGLVNTSIENPIRRDRLSLIGVIAAAFLTLLGAAGETLGLDRKLKANTSKRRTHSLFRQGREYIRGVVDRFSMQLRQMFLNLFENQAHVTEVYGFI